MAIKFGERVASARAERNWTQAELGRRVGVSQATIAHWESGKKRPRPERLRLLSRKLGVRFTLIDLFGEVA